MKPRDEHLNLIHKWLRYKEHLDLSAVFHNQKWKNVAIYGGGYTGELLYEYLVKANIAVKCIIDINLNLDFPYDVTVISPNKLADYCNDLDVIIITPLDYYYIKSSLRPIVNCPIVSLDKLVIEIDDLHFMFNLIKYIKQSGTRLLLCDLFDPVLCIKNPSILELRSQAHGNNGSYADFFNPFGVKLEFLLSYYDDLPICSKEYIKEVYTTNYCKHVEKNGALYMQDIESEYVNIINNLRYTTDEPSVYDNTIHFFGNCNAVGCFTEDKYTIQSQLQRMLNDLPLHNKMYRVLNHSNWRSYIDSMKQMFNVKFCYGDIVVLIGNGMEELTYYLDSEVVHYYIDSAFNRPHGMGEIFFDMYHMNHRGYKLIANRIYSILSETKIFNTSNIEKETQKHNILTNEFLPRRIKTEKAIVNNSSLSEYISFLRKEKVYCNGIIGAIVMNCNPFTLGHKFLIQEARMQCDFLYIFVVEEDKSFFSFADRFMLVKAATSELGNVKVIPSGSFIISSITLPEYFLKDSINDMKIDASKDIDIFMNNIAPTLNISKRFVGEEPLDPITNQYNQAMIMSLPRNGINVVVIPRKEYDGIPISASYVRELLKLRDFHKISKIVPTSTLNYLKKNCSSQIAAVKTTE